MLPCRPKVQCFLSSHSCPSCAVTYLNSFKEAVEAAQKPAVSGKAVAAAGAGGKGINKEPKLGSRLGKGAGAGSAGQGESEEESDDEHEEQESWPSALSGGCDSDNEEASVQLGGKRKRDAAAADESEKATRPVRARAQSLKLRE